MRGEEHVRCRNAAAATDDQRLIQVNARFVEEPAQFMPAFPATIGIEQPAVGQAHRSGYVA